MKTEKGTNLNMSPTVLINNLYSLLVNVLPLSTLQTNTVEIFISMNSSLNPW
jgi:hypothetical protein